MKRLSPPRKERFRPFITPPWVLAATEMPPDVAIMAPDSALICSPAARVTRATANDGWWRSAMSMPGTLFADQHLRGVVDDHLPAVGRAPEDVERRGGGAGVVAEDVLVDGDPGHEVLDLHRLVGEDEL